jgi:hypothetical protein
MRHDTAAKFAVVSRNRGQRRFPPPPRASSDASDKPVLPAQSLSKARSPSSGALDVDHEPLAQDPKRLVDLVEARGMTQIEQSVDLGRMPIESPSKLGF